MEVTRIRDKTTGQQKNAALPHLPAMLFLPREVDQVQQRQRCLACDLSLTNLPQGYLQNR